MNYIVIDLEYNQAFDFTAGEKTQSDPRCPVEIIQIGAVKMNSHFEITDKAGFYIKPQVYPRLHPFVSRITGITKDLLESARLFPEVYNEFVKFAGQAKYTLCTWGQDDVKELYKNILYYKLNTKLLTRKYINVQKLAGACLKFGNGSIGLKAAVKSFGIEEAFDFHDALNDAVYTAEIFKVVKDSGLQVVTVNLNQLKAGIAAKLNGVNTRLLFGFAENRLKRKLTPFEKDAVLKIYGAGREHRFDLLMPDKN